MSRQIRNLRPPEPSDFDLYELPQSIPELLREYQATNEPFLRILMLSQTKSAILSTPVAPPPPLEHPSGAFRNLNQLFMHVIVSFFERGYRLRGCTRGEVRLLFKVVSLAVKHFFDLDDFKALNTKLTDLLEVRRDRVPFAMDFFTEVIETIEEEPPQEEEEREPAVRCRFEWSFASQHLNSMLQIANLLLMKATTCYN